jgi:hypothetical protein
MLAVTRCPLFASKISKFLAAVLLQLHEILQVASGSPSQSITSTKPIDLPISQSRTQTHTSDRAPGAPDVHPELSLPTGENVSEAPVNCPPNPSAPSTSLEMCVSMNRDLSIYPLQVYFLPAVFHITTLCIVALLCRSPCAHFRVASRDSGRPWPRVVF